MKFKHSQIVRRKESHKNAWWNTQLDGTYIVMHNTKNDDESMYIYPVGKTIDDFISVYTHSMELVD